MIYTTNCNTRTKKSKYFIARKFGGNLPALLYDKKLKSVNLRRLILFSEASGGDIEEFSILCNGPAGNLSGAGFGELFANLVVI